MQKDWAAWGNLGLFFHAAPKMGMLENSWKTFLTMLEKNSLA